MPHLPATGARARADCIQEVSLASVHGVESEELILFQPKWYLRLAFAAACPLRKGGDFADHGVLAQDGALTKTPGMQESGSPVPYL